MSNSSPMDMPKQKRSTPEESPSTLQTKPQEKNDSQDRTARSSRKKRNENTLGANLTHRPFWTPQLKNYFAE